MRQIKSLWTRPAGWQHLGADNLWRLSCARLVKHHGEVWVYTDATGEAWLRTLGLPKGVFIVRELDSLRFDPHLWAMGKVAACSLQREPFIHTDADVIIGRPFARRILAADICAERVYQNLPGSWFKRAKAHENWKRDFAAGNGTSFNCGMFGGNDMLAVFKYSSASMEFAAWNESLLKTVRHDLANMACEEWAIAREFDPLEVSCYSAMGDGGSMMHKHARSYWHLAGPSKVAPENLALVRSLLAEETHR